ncbi:geranylgeranyl reductase family protein [Nocardia sp. NPDC058658]|uniref:geranylgeranyl reductase family protein n=1 Tax=Nocardia sp. NPDC058658 TaxID=3346580 RepID=UPI00366815EA
MSDRFDIAVVGGGPAGAAAAWKAAAVGARVVCFDKAAFPREKPCGDGITPRAASLVAAMGLGASLTKFHQIDGIRVFSPRRWQASWPEREGIPRTAYVARRTDFDQMLITHAAATGADVRERTRVVAPIMERGRVAGVVVRDEMGTERIVRADVVIAADGAYSTLKRALAPASSINGYTAVAIRAEMDACRDDDNYYEIYTRLWHENRALPGYGWVFPLGDQRVNIGIGYLTSYRKWRQVNAADLMANLMADLPSHWQLPDLGSLRRSKALQAWRLPTGFNTWPPFLPGIMFAGDAAGTVKPGNGAGISKALQSGMIAGECAVNSLQTDGPDDFSDYAQQLSQLWGTEYRMGRVVHRVIGNPRAMHIANTLLDQPRARRTTIRVLYGKDGLASYTEE